jgi:hypothetical protein
MHICRVLVVLVVGVMSIMAREAAPVDAPYNKVFDPWRACMAAEALAKRGAPDALRTMFLAAYVRVNQPFLGGEDLEEMHLVFGRVLAAVGDAKFSRALALQRPEVRSAVRCFSTRTVDRKKNYPKTDKLLRETPDIDWPADKAGREDR